MEISLGGGKSKAGSGKGSGCGVYVFGGIFALVGIVGTVALCWVFLRNLDTHFWKETSATIHQCEIDVSGGEDAPFRMLVDYEYTAGTEVFRSQRYTLDDGYEDNYEKLSLAKARLLAPGHHPVCFVDPDDPTRAVLKRGSLWFGLFIFLPLIFVLIGFGVIWGAVREGKGPAKKGGGSVSISEKAKPRFKMSPMARAVLFGLLAAGGIAAIVPMTKALVIRPIASGSWIEVPCEIIWSRVQRHEGDDGDTYSVDIFYGYEFNGESHRSNRYSFTSGSSSGRSGKVAIVKKFPRGSEQRCFVNPKVPQQAVLKPGFTPLAFLCVLPLVAFVVGAWGLASAIGVSGAGSPRGGADPYRGASSGAARAGESAVEDGVQEFTPGSKRMTAVVFVLVFALFWNGVISIFLVEIIGGWKRGHGDWFQTLFFVPFALVGIGLIVGFVYSLLRLFNPAPILRLSPGPARLGEPLTLEWEMKGASARIRQFRIWIHGVESATYRRGTDTVTDEEIFYCVEAVNKTHALEMARGSVALTLPHDSMCSFDSGNNEILWRVVVEGEIGFWPDIGDSHKIAVKGPDPGMAHPVEAATSY